MFHPADAPMQRGWVGRLDGDEVVHLASQTLQHLFTGGGTAREHARYPLAEVILLLPLPRRPRCASSTTRARSSSRTPRHSPAPTPRCRRLPTPRSWPTSGSRGSSGSTPSSRCRPSPGCGRRRLRRRKDRDFGIVLGPFFTTTDEAPAAPLATAEVGESALEVRIDQPEWEAARGFAAENTRLRVGDLLLAPTAAAVGGAARRGGDARGREPRRPPLLGRTSGAAA